jgi:ABC-type multidrug transport system ATPase subunit
MDVAIRTDRLTKRYNGRAVVDTLTFEVPKGSIYGFLGPNGAGKTTTFAMLCGFIRPASGSAEVLGQPLSNLPRDRMAALPQDARFHPERTLEDSLRFMAELQGLPADRARSETDRVLAAVDLNEARKVRGKALSHGMAKRFGIAQAFLGSPELVLLDEPTEGLDPRNAHTVRQMIRTMAGRATVLVSSHNLTEVQDLCDHAAIIDRGRLVAQSSIAEMTGQDQQVLIRLGRTASGSLVTLKACPRVAAVNASPDGLTLRVSLRVRQGDTVEEAITEALAALLQSGATVGSVIRGHSLEERFLELT